MIKCWQSRHEKDNLPHSKKEENMKHLGTKRIETKRLVLRRFTIEDAEHMYKNWASDEEVTRFLMWPVHESVESTRNLLKTWIEAYAEDTKYEWCIALKENDEPIGSMGVIKIVEKAELMEIGYCISRAWWHQGITSEALAAVMDFLFDEVGVNRVESRHDTRNPHSGQVMKKCGMRYEGTSIEADWNNSGVCDKAFYGLTKSQRSQARGNEADSRSAGTEEKTGTTKAERTKDPEAKEPKNVISDETIEYVGILAKLELTAEEKEQAKKDIGEMLDYIDKLGELDTAGVEPMSHAFPVNNVFREDIVENEDDRDNMLKNAPEVKDGSYKVPKTVE